MTLLLILGLAAVAAILFALLLGWSLCQVSGRAGRAVETAVSRVVQDTQPNEDTL